MNINKPRNLDENDGSAPAEDTKNMPIGVGDFSGEEPTALDPLAGSDTVRRFKGGSIVLGGVIVIACGGLWLMRTVNTVRGGTTSTNDIEQTVDKFLKAIQGDGPGDATPRSNLLAGNDHGVLDVLKQSYTDQQIPLSNVHRDPFAFYDEVGTDAAPADTGDSNQRVAQRRAEIQKAADTLRLKSVIMGSQPLANISSKIVRAGDEFIAEPSNIAFRVAEITSDLVKLVVEDPALNLKVGIDLPLKRDQLK